jgi:hypothetical protein
MPKKKYKTLLTALSKVEELLVVKEAEIMKALLMSKTIIRLAKINKTDFFCYFAITKRSYLRFENKPFMKNLSFFFLSLSLQAQFQVNGLVTAASDGKPLVASVIADNDTKTITDVDGKFTITTKKYQLILCILHRFR